MIFIVSPIGKKIVFFDEFPWFDTARSDFMLAFEEFWNRCGTQHGDLLFIICGSATSWIIDNVINDTESLYHRTTAHGLTGTAHTEHISEVITLDDMFEE